MRPFCLSGMMLLLSVFLSGAAFGQTGVELQPVSGADGVFETVVLDGETVYRSIPAGGEYHFYMYFKTDEFISNQTVYVEVTYLDTGQGMIGLEYNSVDQDYRLAERGFNAYFQGTGQKRTAVYELVDADFRNAQNLGTDLRISSEPSVQMHIISATLFLEPTALFNMYDEHFLVPYNGPVYTGDDLVGSDALTGKVICGYQGWFRAAGDPSGQGWVHYVNGDFTDLTVDMWPDMSEYSLEEQYPVQGWTYEDGSQATLFSSANKRSVLRHFQWMEAYGIDGAAIQRFIFTENLELPNESFRIPAYAREAANRTGRTYYIMYDMTGCDTTVLVDVLRADWKALVDSMKITEDERYLHQNGKPVVGIFGFYRRRFSAALGRQILDIFQNEGKYNAFVAGSGFIWTTVSEPEWLEVFSSMDAWTPWNVGNWEGDYANTSYWEEDQAFYAGAGVLYMPLVHPGFSWDNLMDEPPGTTYKSRLKGKFLWQQFLDARQLNTQALYVAMFDEIDEGTAIFKVTNDLPVNHYFIDLEGLNSDFYLLMVGEGTRLLRNEIPVPHEMPDFTLLSKPPIPDLLVPFSADTLVSPVEVMWTAVEHESGITGYQIEINNQMINYVNHTASINLDDGEYLMRVRAINGLGNPGGWSERIKVSVNNALSARELYIQQANRVRLLQNYPNPVDDHTWIPFSIQDPGIVRLDILRVDGRLITTLLNTYMTPGTYQIAFNPDGFSNGIYLYRITNGSSVSTKKMTLLR